MSNKTKLLILLFLLGFGVIVARNAWLSDDAYITFRTVDNFVHGRGLTWNPGERVQAYTHPLWMFLLSAGYAVTGEIYYTSLFISLTLSLAAVGLLAFRGARSPSLALLGVTVLTLSKAFVDYSTSGLENPLSHLILVAFLLVYLQPRRDARTLFQLSLLAALGMVNRVDLALLLGPPLAVAFFRSEREKRWRALAAGLSPFVVWELFSLFYYGFPFPNTAYAKLNLGLIPPTGLMEVGGGYLANSLNWDPLTLGVIGLGLIAPLVLKDWRFLPLVAGVVVYLLYLLRVGDFMSGRFLAAPLLVAVTILVSTRLTALEQRRWALTAAVVLLAVGLSSPYSPVLPGATQSAGTDANGVTDEKGTYWPHTNPLQAGSRLDHDWAQEGRADRQNGPAVVEKGSIGFYGYFVGSEVHVVDLLGLADPLLARLPPVDPNWRVGHYGRRPPEGYLESLTQGQNHLSDPDLALYYDKLSILTRGDLFDLDRLGEIVRFNTGAYQPYLDAYAWFEGKTFVRRLRLSNPGDQPYVMAYVWNNDRAEAYLLDDASEPGETYSLTWTIGTTGATFEGDYLEKRSSIGPLSDDMTLNVGVMFSASPDFASAEVFEHRYWFEQRGDELAILAQGVGWHNPQAPDGFWVEADVSPVIGRRRPAAARSVSD